MIRLQRDGEQTGRQRDRAGRIESCLAIDHQLPELLEEVRNAVGEVHQAIKHRTSRRASGPRRAAPAPRCG